MVAILVHRLGRRASHSPLEPVGTSYGTRWPKSIGRTFGRSCYENL
ncbi:hypothetical protein RB394 [Rhodopirellula baltica SH 1]|uniref:Uncharacterized protein n=1 Tax=Rhodopirellula baltica (strain DSM 10527 / NCIMB 13988 / SH1) TaxID=243090 RepID=Q7UYT3_RHOBA|nr:hypothetical protein RB394 [Rhodopirellula baltica SH 1]